MTPTEYRALREKIGSPSKVAKILDVTTNTISNREHPDARIRREAEYALRWAAEIEWAHPSAEVTRLKPHRRKI